MPDRPPSALLIVAFFIGCGGSRQRPVASAPTRHPVVLITLDTTRADRIGAYGHVAATTPALDQLARSGVLFEQARTVAPLTLPAHASILTGTYPPFHGIRDNGVALLSDRAATLAEAFRAEGYATAAFVSAAVLDARYGLDQGFDLYDDVQAAIVPASGFFDERRADATVDRALTWLDSIDAAETPYFLWLHLFDPHAPYAPPPPFDRNDDPYDGEIAFVDAQLARLLRRIESRIDGASTTVLVTADHGEGLGDHGETSHGVFLYDSSIRVPWIVAGPNIPAATRIADAVSVVDIVPTLLELTGLPPIEDAQGISVVDAIRSGQAIRQAVYFESYNGFLNHGWSPLVGLCNGKTKIVDAPRPELFDVRVDPGEADNLATLQPRLLADLSRSSQQFFARVSNPNPLGEARDASAEERRELEQLGYTIGATPSGPLPYVDPTLPDPKERRRTEEARQQGLALLRRFQSSQFRDRVSIDAAVDLYENALDEDPESAVLHEYLGTALVMRGDAARAIHPLREALARRPERTDARYNLAVALVETKDRDAACRQLDLLLELEPEFVKGARLLALLREELGQLPQAAAAWRHVLDHHPVDDDERRFAHDRLDQLESRLNRR